MAGERVLLALAGVLALGLACAGSGSAPDAAPSTTTPETSVRPFHEPPLLAYEDGTAFLDPLPDGATATEPAAVSLGLITARLSDQRRTARLGPLTAEVGLAYGDPRHDPWLVGYSVDEGLDGRHLLVQAQADLSSTDCDRLKAWLGEHYGAGATDQGYAVSWSYKVQVLSAPGAAPGACRVWVAFEPPRETPGDPTSELLPLPDAHRRAFLVLWRDLVPRAATGASVEALVAEAGALPDELRGALQTRLDKVAGSR